MWIVSFWHCSCCTFLTQLILVFIFLLLYVYFEFRRSCTHMPFELHKKYQIFLEHFRCDFKNLEACEHVKSSITWHLPFVLLLVTEHATKKKVTKTCSIRVEEDDGHDRKRWASHLWLKTWWRMEAVTSWRCFRIRAATKWTTKEIKHVDNGEKHIRCSTFAPG